MPSIETARLYLRMFRPDDLDNLATLSSDPDVMRFVGDGKPASLAACQEALESIIRHWRQHGFGRWALVDKETETFVGFGGLRSMMGTPELVYHLAKRFWGRGLATELGKASLRYGFEEHKFARIVAIAKPENLASLHVMEKLGMRYEMHTCYYNIDVVQYAISPAEFLIDESPYILHSG
jgi:RimJ/RimL family protein N-acetyltransferase